MVFIGFLPSVKCTWLCIIDSLYSISPLCTHKKFNYAHNSETVKLTYQLQDSRLLYCFHSYRNSQSSFSIISFKTLTKNLIIQHTWFTWKTLAFKAPHPITNWSHSLLTCSQLAKDFNHVPEQCLSSAVLQMSSPGLIRIGGGIQTD